MTKQTYLILGVIIILLAAGALFAWEKTAKVLAPVTPAPQPPVVAHPIIPINQTPPTSYQKLAGWKTYENKEFGFEISYPGEWFTYDRETFLRDNGGSDFGKCGATGGTGLSDAVIFSRKDLGKCVDLAYSSPLIGDFALRTSSFFSQDPVNRYKEKPEEKIINIGGVQALKTSELEKISSFPKYYITTIEFNYNKRSYVIFLRQIDRNGHYDTILDQILSTFRFLK